MIYPSAPVMGYSVYSGSLDEIRFDERLTVINTLNAYSFVTAEKDAVFKRALQSSDILIADGFPIVIAARLLGGYKIRKIAGADMFHYVLKFLHETSGSCFFLGSSVETLERIKRRIVTEYPKIRVSFYSPPFKDQYSDQDTHEMLNSINQAKPFAVFVGMTAPKQEKWV
jgi:N-acetylglucosaminyldiphosphoundecaprenol N-acetyl-beta-D-mannosaminyltransferase